MHEHDIETGRTGAQHFVLRLILRTLVVPEEVLEMRQRLFGRELTVLGDAEGRDGARVHEACRADRVHRADQIHRPADVDVVEDRGIGRPEAIDRGQMEHGVDAGDRALDGSRIANVGGHAFDREPVEQRVITTGFDQCSHGVPTGCERPRDGRADEARCARDEHPPQRSRLPRFLVHASRIAHSPAGRPALALARSAGRRPAYGSGYS